MQTTLREQVLFAAEAAGDDPAPMTCMYRPLREGASAAVLDVDDEESFGEVVQCSFAELADRPFGDEYGDYSVDRFLGFTARFVYIVFMYDGRAKIVAVPRDPAVVLAGAAIPIIE